jgi:hypothetical protein
LTDPIGGAVRRALSGECVLVKTMNRPMPAAAAPGSVPAAAAALDLLLPASS